MPRWYKRQKRHNTRGVNGRFEHQIDSLMQSEMLPRPLSRELLPETPVLNLHLEQYENIFVTPKSPVVPLPGTPESPTPPTIEYRPDSPPALVSARAPAVVDLVSPASAKPDSDGYAEVSSDSSAEKPSLADDLKQLFSAEKDNNNPFAVPCLGRRHSGSKYYNSERTFHNVRDIQMVKYYKQGLFNSMLPMDPDYDTICFTATSRHRNLADMSERSTLDYKLLLEWNKGLLGTAERPLTRSSTLRAGVQIWTPIPALFEDWVKSKQMHDMLLLPRI